MQPLLSRAKAAKAKGMSHRTRRETSVADSVRAMERCAETAQQGRAAPPAMLFPGAIGCALHAHELAGGAAYRARVRCRNRTGWSKWSSWSRPTTTLSRASLQKQEDARLASRAAAAAKHAASSAGAACAAMLLVVGEAVQEERAAAAAAARRAGAAGARAASAARSSALWAAAQVEEARRAAALQMMAVAARKRGVSQAAAFDPQGGAPNGKLARRGSMTPAEANGVFAAMAAREAERNGSPAKHGPQAAAAHLDAQHRAEAAALRRKHHERIAKAGLQAATHLLGAQARARKAELQRLHKHALEALQRQHSSAKGRAVGTAAPARKRRGSITNHDANQRQRRRSIRDSQPSGSDQPSARDQVAHALAATVTAKARRTQALLAVSQPRRESLR